jgi:ribosomal-protein-alanine N-acetyltransferase
MQDALSGRKVTLRLPSSKDHREFIALNRASKQANRGLISMPTNEQQFAAFRKRSNTESSICFFICLVKNGSIIGAASLSQIFRGGFQNAYLGYYVASPYTGHGYMTEALELMLRYAFKNLKLHRLEANVQPGNAASIALVKRAGFVLEGYSERYLKVCGRWRDHERWAITSEVWRARRNHSRPASQQ